LRVRRLFFGVRAELGFFLILLLSGLQPSAVGPVAATLGVLSAVLVHELGRALYAGALGRSSTIVLTARGHDTEVAGPPLGAAAALGFVAVGSLANLAVAAALTLVGLARHDMSVPLTLTWRALAYGHAAWGVSQVLPLAPLRCGQLIAGRVSGTRSPPPLRCSGCVH